MNYLIQDASGNITRITADPATKRLKIPTGSIGLGLEWELNPQKLDILTCIFDGHRLQLNAGKQATLAALAAKKYTENILSNAMIFGNKLIVEFGAENMRMGITGLGKTNEVRKALSEVMSALLAGSLFDAITEVRAIPAEDKDLMFITDARLLVFVNKIEDYLHVARSTRL